VYNKDVYEPYPATGNIFETYTDVNGVTQVRYNITHHAGDPILDVNGVTTYLHKTGDIVMDSNGLPTIDLAAGVTRHIDIMMLEYEFKLANSTPYQNYITDIYNIIRNWLLIDILNIN